MRKGIAISLASGLLSVVFLCFLFLPSPDGGRQEVTAHFRTEQKKIQLLREGIWEDFEIRGVNIGTGYPGVFPNEFGISQETYGRWLQLISEMNANTIRIYKIHPPAFYAALAAHNKSHEQKLYLIQGIDLREDLMYTEKSIHDREQKEQVLRHTREVVDSLHGKRLSLEGGDLCYYRDDVSDYVLGYVLGIEWDEIFVEYICRLEEGLAPHAGAYVSAAASANPFESFLAWWGDELFSYETSRYGVQKLLSYANWPETDPLVNEVSVGALEIGFQENSEALIDLEQLRLSDQVTSGMFASYNVYPYFPTFLQYGQYTFYIDDEGVRNPYRGYLMDLTEHHTCPVVITEYGIPACRGTAYHDVWRGFSQGGSTEREQGAALVQMYNDIRKAGCAGSLVFTWQDEWYKTVWNEKVLSAPDGRANWCNAQCVEEFYGLLAFEPKSGDDCVYPDGDIAEWRPQDVIHERGAVRLSARADEKYLHVMVQGTDARDDHAAICLAFDILPDTGAAQAAWHCFERDVDFLLRIGNDGEGELLVHRDADIAAFSAAIKNKIAVIQEIDARERELSITSEGKDTTFRTVARAYRSIEERFETRTPYAAAGLMKEGDANPNHKGYDSNADFFRGDGFVEIRIPWQLLNFYDPSACLIIDDYRKTGYQIRERKIDAIHVTAFYDDEEQPAGFGSFPLRGWKMPEHQERLKDSYYMIKEAFGEP